MPSRWRLSGVKRSVVVPVTAALVRRWLPVRRPDAHKGDVGRVFLLGGSRGMAGAGVLTAWGAVSSGAGLVMLATPASERRTAALRAPLEAMTVGLPHDRAGRLARTATRPLRAAWKTFRPTVLAAGPGLGVSDGVRHTLRRMVADPPAPLVLDADALNALSLGELAGRGAMPLVITPHPGELARLLGTTTRRIQSDRVRFVRAAAVEMSCIVVLKGQGTLISDGERIFRNTTGNAAMASGGMGDVLTGVMAALWGQMGAASAQAALAAAALAAFLHGRAGDLLVARQRGLSVLANEVARAVPAAIRTLRT